MNTFSEHNIVIFLVQVSLLLGLARGLGELFRRWKQPALTAEILVGIVLGPTVFGRFFPRLHLAIFPPDPLQQGMLGTVAWLGLLFFLLETGLHMDFLAAWRQKTDALTIALTDIVVPMTIAFSLSLILPASYLVDPDKRLVFALFMATVMTISAMPITVRALHDLNLTKTDLGFLIMSALAVNEVIGWLIFTFVLGFFSQTQVLLTRTIVTFLIAIVFITLCLSWGRKLMDRVMRAIKEQNLPEPGTSLTVISLLGFICGAIFQKIGMHALLGFFVAGVMAGEARALPERTRQVISQMVYALFVPLFFAGVGLSVDFFRNFDLFLVAFVTIISILGKFLGAWLGATFSRTSKSNRLAIAITHSPGGSMQIVVGALALSYNVISETVFVAIVFGAVVSAIILAPWLKYAIARRKKISILEFFSSRDIISELSASTRDTAIRQLCDHVAEQANVPDSDTLYASVMQRELAMGTAIEEGTALPHARILSLIRPVVVFGRSTPGIDWDSPDGKQTHFIFLILTPEGDDQSQIQILRFIAKTLYEKTMRDAIMDAQTSAEVWHILRQALTPVHICRK